MLIPCVRATDNVLLSLRDIIQAPGLDKLSELLKNVEMFRGIAFALLKLWEVLYDSLHVLDCAKLSLALLFREEGLYKVVDGIGYVAKVAEHYLLEEFIVITG